MRRSLLVVALLLPPTTLPAQVTVDAAAAAARGHWRSASQRLEGGDSLGALAALDSAVAAWPSQAAYARAAARLAARLGLSDRALTSLDALTALGGEWRLADPALARIATDPRVHAAAARNGMAVAPLVRSTPLWTVGNDSLLVEGVAWDSATGRWFISSVLRQKVLVRERDGRVRDFMASGSGGVGAILGMAVDGRRGLLWVTSAERDTTQAELTYNGHSRLMAFDLLSGAFRASYELPEVAGGHQLGDVIVTPRGDLFASDSRSPTLYRIPVGTLPTRIEVVVQGDALFRSLQGMVATEDGRVLYLTDYSHGLLRVDLATRRVTSLAAPAGTTLLGIDGLASGGPGILVGVQNGITPVRVIAIHLSRDGMQVQRIEVLDRPPLAPGEATLGVRAGRSFVYVATVPASLRTLELDR